MNDLPFDDKRIVGSIRHERPHRVLAMISDCHASFLRAVSIRPEYWCTCSHTKGFVKRTRWRNERTIRNLQYVDNRFDCRFRWSSIITRLDSVILRLCPCESSIYERCPSDSFWKPRNETGLFLSPSLTARRDTSLVRWCLSVRSSVLFLPCQIEGRALANESIHLCHRDIA